ncbi:cytochrome P450 [Streptomyces purpurogeneiscleroticus]|uniref:cytochrome P450 n=1 Tax=Streptomyces purpurogeneiscleroticus TaxID=68259 RepID=UPI001CBD5D12|nr:cytochrome P450 [Streptomyces purpurogeneiscleroticus]MBZ4015389.1 cytochrome [Streptomyces purpurogeneiscleroticus]
MTIPIPEHLRARFELKAHVGRPLSDEDPGGLLRLHGPEAADPTALFARLRATYGQVAPVLLPGDLPVWLVLGYQANLDVARTPYPYTRDSRLWNLADRVPAGWPLGPTVDWEPTCAFTDGPAHARVRSAVTDSLDDLDRHGIRRYVVRYTKMLVNEFIRTGKADLVGQYAERLPMFVMTRLLGMDEADGPRLADAARDLMTGSDTAAASNDIIVTALTDLMESKKGQPGNDLTSWLSTHESGLSDVELHGHLRLVLIAAYETTANLIANTLHMILTDRRFRASLSGGHMTLTDALEGMLWDELPLSVVPGRWASGDSMLDGWRIEAGDMLLLGPGAANVDPEIRPDLSVPMHGNRSHLAFSAGPHRCPGEDIGRAIADTGIDTLLTLLPDMQLTVEQDEVRWDYVMLSKRLSELPVQFQPRPPVALSSGTFSGRSRRAAAAAGCPVTGAASTTA